MAAAAMMMSLTPTQSIQPNQPDTIVGGFSNDFTEVQKDSLTTLEGAMRTMSECRSGGGPSDCSSPINGPLRTESTILTHLSYLLQILTGENFCITAEFQRVGHIR